MLQPVLQVFPAFPARYWSFLQSRLVAHTRLVLARAGINADYVADFNKQRNMDFRAGFQGCWLGAARRTVALQTWLGVLNLELNRDRKPSKKSVALIEGHLHAHVFLQELRGVA